MSLTSAEHSRIAAAYERAAQDQTLPQQPREGFTKNAQWFRMLAQIAAAKEAAASERADKGNRPNAKQEPALCVGFLVEALNRRSRASSDIRFSSS